MRDHGNQRCKRSLLTPFLCVLAEFERKCRLSYPFVFKVQLFFRTSLTFQFNVNSDFEKPNMSNWPFGWKPFLVNFGIGLLCEQFCDNTHSKNVWESTVETSVIIVRCMFSFSFSARSSSRDLHADNCLQIMVCCCTIPLECANNILLICAIVTTLLREKMSDCFP